MRFVAVFLALLFVGLSIVPCADDGYHDPAQTTIVSSDLGNVHHHSPDNCSPLCGCSCCGSVVTEADAPIAAIEKESLPEILNTRATRQLSLQSPHYPIWEPPKISFFA